VPIWSLTWPPTLAQRRRLAIAVLCLVAAFVGWRHLAAGPAGGDAAGTSALARAPGRARPRPVAQAAASKLLVVDVVGAVRSAGLVRLPSGSRVADAVRAAGGLTARADPLLVNLAAPVADGEQVMVAARGAPAGAPGASGGGAAGAPAAPVDLNSASAEQLDALPGVGPVTAQKIVAYRQQHGPFTSADGLDAIPGIGPARIADLKGLVTP
jgi:competence protein ComEA